MDQQEIDRIVANCNKIAQSFRIELEKEPKHRIGSRTLSPLTSFQFLDLLRKLKDEVQNLSIQEIITIYNKIQLNFSNSYIKEDIYYSGVLPNINFSGSVFDGKVAFENVVFIGSTNFSGSIFNGIIQFNNINENHKINNVIHFNSAEINFAEFNNIKCSEIHFRSSKIMGCRFNILECINAYFEDTHIRKGGSLFFTDADIMMHAMFNSLVLDSGTVSFSKIKCNHEFDLSNNNFQYFELNDSHIEGKVSFVDSKFHEKVDFNKKLIFNKVDFTHVEFEKRTNFSNVEFKTPPLFHKATLHQNTSFRNAKFMSTSTDDDLLAYRTLQQKMKEINNRLDEGLFFAYEQRTLRNLDAKDMRKNWPTVIVSAFYDLISGYGQDILRPIICLIGVIAIFAILYSYPHAIEVNKAFHIQWIRELPPNFGLALQNIFKPFIFDKDLPFIVTNGWITLASIIQSLLTLAIITLWLLAVRRRFQKGE